MTSLRRPALAIPRPQAPPLGLRVRVPRTWVFAVALVFLAGLVYLAARQTSLFSLRSIEVSGAPGEVAAQVRKALRPFLGTSLVALAADDPVHAAEALPTVLSATVDRDFPHTLRVSIRPERPVAVVRQGAEAWLVSARGRVMERVELGGLARLPRIWITARDPLAPGTYLLADQGGAAVTALARLPEKFPGHVESARGTPDSLVLVLASKTEIRLGEASDLRLKVAVAATVLSSVGAGERDSLAYLDVSLPTRPVVALKSQVEA